LQSVPDKASHAADEANVTPIAGWNARATACAADGDKLDASIWQGGDCVVEASFQTIAVAAGAIVAADANAWQRER